MGHHRSWLHIETSLIKSIWRTWNGSVHLMRFCGWKHHQIWLWFASITLT
jgi:hypothetical protein